VWGTWINEAQSWERGGTSKRNFEKYWSSLLLHSSWSDTGMVCRLRSERQKYRVWIRVRGLGSVVGIATGYGLDGPGIESRWGVRFSAPVQTGPGAHPASYVMGTGSFPGDKERPGRDAEPSPSSSAVVMKE